jgi:hypothetical protein
MTPDKIKNYLVLLFTTKTLSIHEYNRLNKIHKKYSSGFPLTKRETAMLQWTFELGAAMFPRKTDASL